MRKKKKKINPVPRVVLSWGIPVIPPFQMVKQIDCIFKTSLGLHWEILSKNIKERKQKERRQTEIHIQRRGDGGRRKGEGKRKEKKTTSVPV